MSAWDSMWITPEASWVCSGAIRCRARSMPSAAGVQAASRSTPVAIATATATRWLGLSLLLAVAARGRRRMGGLVMAALLLRTWDADAQGGCWRLNAAAGQRSLRPARSAAL